MNNKFKQLSREEYFYKGFISLGWKLMAGALAMCFSTMITNVVALMPYESDTFKLQFQLQQKSNTLAHPFSVMSEKDTIEISQKFPEMTVASAEYLQRNKTTQLIFKLIQTMKDLMIISIVFGSFLLGAGFYMYWENINSKSKI